MNLSSEANTQLRRVLEEEAAEELEYLARERQSERASAHSGKTSAVFEPVHQILPLVPCTTNAHAPEPKRVETNAVPASKIAAQAKDVVGAPRCSARTPIKSRRRREADGDTDADGTGTL